MKDLINRGGEKIVRLVSLSVNHLVLMLRPWQDSITVENAIHADDRINEVAAVGVPDSRLGELVAAVVSPKPSFRGQVKEEEIIEMVRNS